MRVYRKLPLREQVFVASLAYHGFRVTRRRKGLKLNRGYVIPSTKQEDASLIDFWIKLPRSSVLIPIQVTQRGNAIFRQRQAALSEERLRDFNHQSESRLRRKRRACKRSGIAFVVIRDHLGDKPSRSLAWGDRKALRYALRMQASGTARVSIC